MIQDDEKYKSLRDSLSGLPKVKAKTGFEARLLQRIKETEKGVIHKPEIIRQTSQKSWFANLFRPSFAPALGLTAVLLITVVVYFAYFAKTGDQGPQNEMVTSTDKQGEFVIYVRKDSESYSDNYPKEYSAITPDGTTEERTMAPIEMPSDYMSRPEVRDKDIESEIRNDRVSEEQKLEMERSLEKGVDSKGERKSDDMIMKKESKTHPKGEMKKSETKNEGEAPFNIRDEKEGYIEDDTNVQKQESPSIKADEKTGTEKDEIYYQNEAPRLGRVITDTNKVKSKSPKDRSRSERGFY